MNGLISGLATAALTAIDAKLAGKDNGEIIYEAGVGFLVGFGVGSLAGFSSSALLKLIGPKFFAKIVSSIPWVLLVLGGMSVKDSIDNGLTGQAIFRTIITLISAGLANATIRGKVFDIAKYLWVRYFLRPLPTLAGATPPIDGGRKVLYNAWTKQIWVGSQNAWIHPDVYIEAGWNYANPDNMIVGGNAVFEAGKLVEIKWVSGFFPGDAMGVLEAEASAALASILGP